MKKETNYLSGSGTTNSTDVNSSHFYHVNTPSKLRPVEAVDFTIKYSTAGQPVLLNHVQDEDEVSIVEIKTRVYGDLVDSVQFCTAVNFGFETELAQQYIKDFSQEAVDNFCTSCNV